MLNVLLWLLLTHSPDWEFISPDSEVLSFQEGSPRPNLLPNQIKIPTFPNYTFLQRLCPKIKVNHNYKPFKTTESDIKGLLWNIKSHLDRGSEIVQGLQVVSSQGSHELVFVVQPYNLFMNNVWMDGIPFYFYSSLSFLGLVRGTDWQSISISQISSN